MPDPDPAVERPPRWPWAWFVVAAAWSVVVRVPLVLNARTHLDSDLAVDGLTLLEATRGHFRWHYPGTPFIGTGPVFLSLPQALIWGANPWTLVSGGGVAWLGLLLAVFLLAWWAFGPRVAVWSLVPLTFASTGSVWLSGRITGGHLVAAVWHAGAFVLLSICLERGRGLMRPTALLGAWCGLGLALDSMFAVTLGGLVTAAVAAWAIRAFYLSAFSPPGGGTEGGSGANRPGPRVTPPNPLFARGGDLLHAPRGARWSGLRVAAVFASALLGGALPRYVGKWVEPYDAYRDQFALVTDRESLSWHARVLAADCLPRLISGHRLPNLESDPDPASISSPATSRRRSGADLVGVCVTGLTLPLAVGALVCLARVVVVGPSSIARVVAAGLMLSAAATVIGFVVNRNIFNSDNYRYLVGLLVPWALGFGLFMEWLLKKGRRGVVLACGLTVLLAVVMTVDLLRWYARFGWVDDHGRPVCKPVDDPALAWLAANPEVRWIEGGYWDVYRLSFLTGGRVRGKPFAVYPDRFPEWRPAPGARRATIVRPTLEGMIARDAALVSGSRTVLRARGLTVLATP